MKLRYLTCIIIAVLIAGCTTLSGNGTDGPGTTTSVGEEGLVEGFAAERLNASTVEYLDAVDSRVVYIASDEAQERLVHGERVIATAQELRSPAYNGTTWGYAYADTETGDERWNVRIGEETVVSGYDHAFVASAGGDWAIGGRRNTSPRSRVLTVAGRQIEDPLTSTRGGIRSVAGRFVFETTVGDHAIAVHHGEEVIASGPGVLGVVGAIDGRPVYERQSDRTYMTEYGNEQNLTELVHGGSVIGEGYTDVADPVRGADGRIYFRAKPPGSSGWQVVTEDGPVINGTRFSDILPYNDSIAVTLERPTGEDALIYADGRRIRYGGNETVSTTYLDVVDGRLAYQTVQLGAGVGADMERVRFLHIGDRKIRLPSYYVAETAIDGRVVLVVQGPEDDWYLLREQP